MTEASINLDHELATSELADVCQHGADSVDDVVGVVSMRLGLELAFCSRMRQGPCLFVG